MPTDEQLMEDLKRGERSALDGLYRRYCEHFAFAQLPVRLMAASGVPIRIPKVKLFVICGFGNRGKLNTKNQAIFSRRMGRSLFSFPTLGEQDSPDASDIQDTILRLSFLVIDSLEFQASTTKVNK